MDVSILVSFGSRGGWRFHGQVVLRPVDGKLGIARSGESGAVWCEGDAAVALLFATDLAHVGSYVVSTPLITVLPHLLGPAWRQWSPLFRG